MPQTFLNIVHIKPEMNYQILQSNHVIQSQLTWADFSTGLVQLSQFQK